MLTTAKLAFAKSGPDLLEATIDALKNRPQPPRNRPAHTTGETERRLRFEATDEDLTMYGPAHFQSLLTGRGPTTSGATAGDTPLREILAQWAEDKGLQLNPGMTYKQFGYLAARKIHEAGTELYQLGQPSGLLDDVLTRSFLDTLKARIAAGEMVSFATELRTVLAL